MAFVESIKTCFIRYSDFKTRAPRSEFWWFALFQVIVNLVTSFPDIYILTIITSILLFIPSLAVGARRLHDTNRSGWWQLLQLPTIYIFIQSGILLTDFSSRSELFFVMTNPTIFMKKILS